MRSSSLRVRGRKHNHSYQTVALGVMSKLKKKRKRVSMTETAELQPDRVIMMQKEVRYDDGQIVCTEYKIPKAFYKQCKKGFALNLIGDWSSIKYEWTSNGWLDAESNSHWLFDE